MSLCKATSKSIVLYLDHGLISTISYPSLACRCQNLMSRDFQRCHMLDLCDFLTCLHIEFWNYHLDVRLYYVMDNIKENKTGAIWVANSYSFISSKISLFMVLLNNGKHKPIWVFSLSLLIVHYCINSRFTTMFANQISVCKSMNSVI